MKQIRGRTAARLCLTGIALLTWGHASAQISLSTAVDLALRNSPKVRMAQTDVNKAHAQLDETYDAYVPSITADAGYGKGLGVPTGLPTVFTLVSQSLVFNFSQRDNIRSAAAGLEAAKLALHEARNQVVEDTTITYLNLNNDQERDEAMTKEHSFAARLVAIVQARLSAGQDTFTALLEGRRTAKQVELDQLQLEDQMATLSNHLSRLMGVTDGQWRTVPNSVPALPSAQAIANGEMTFDSFGVRSALANAKSKQELAFGMERYLLRPQISLGLNYSRIDTGQNDYTEYYPNFVGKSQNAESIYFSVQIPIYDRHQRDASRAAAAEALHAQFDAEDQRNQFFEGRRKLQRSTLELADQCDLAEIDRDLAQEKLNAVLAQLTANAGVSGGTQLTPEDEQNARIEESQRNINLLEVEFQLDQAKVSLLQQTGQLDAWLKTSASTVTGTVTH